MGRVQRDKLNAEGKPPEDYRPFDGTPARRLALGVEYQRIASARSLLTVIAVVTTFAAVFRGGGGRRRALIFVRFFALLVARPPGLRPAPGLAPPPTATVPPGRRHPQFSSSWRASAASASARSARPCAALAQEALRKEELQLRSLVDAMPAMIWRATPAGDIDRWNCRMLAFIGKSQEEIHEQRWLSIVPKDDRDRVHSRWMQAVREGSSYEDTFQLTAADGDLHWYLVRAEPFRDEAGKVIHWYGVCTDIDERKRAEDRLRHTQAELARATKIATVAELSASIAHELNQPLTSIIANAQACITP